MNARMDDMTERRLQQEQQCDFETFALFFFLLHVASSEFISGALSADKAVNRDLSLSRDTRRT